MLVLALDTTTRAGSVALAREGTLVEAFSGDASRTHAARLPGDILALLDRHGVRLPEIDLYGVAAGPGSFTGLRIGIAAIQGLAFANQKPVVAVSALEALANSVGDAGTPATTYVGAWMDAQRGEVYAQLFDAASLASFVPALVAAPRVALDAWGEHLASAPAASLLFVGDGALAYRSIIEARLPGASVAPRVPLLAPAIARLAAHAAARGDAGPPHAIRPLYVRRPDAELARERVRQGAISPSSRADDVHG